MISKTKQQSPWLFRIAWVILLAAISTLIVLVTLIIMGVQETGFTN